MKNVLILFLLSVIFYSCKKETIEHPQNNTCPLLKAGNARYMFSPDSVALNSNISITFVYENGIPCQKFSDFLSNTSNSTTTVSINTTIDTCNCVTNYSPTFLEFSYMAPSTPGHSIIQLTYLNLVQHADTIIVY